METKKGKKIVSKGAYAVNLGSKFALSSFGVMVVVIGAFCLLCTCGLLGMGLLDFKWPDLPFLVLVILLMGGMSVALVFFGVEAVKEAKQTDAGVPHTRANTANLPAPESLVRAASEPAQAQETVLLRAVKEKQETPPEQLVRASTEQK